jgi:hypothetical protein
MEHENLDINNITEGRRKSIAATIKPIGVDEVKKIGEELFPFFDDPWREIFFEFLKENTGCTFHHANASDTVQILYCRDKNRGIWFMPHVGLGPLQPKGLAIMKDIVEKGH